MSSTFVVKTADGFLYPFGLAISYTDDPEHAGHFANADDGHVTAQLFGYLEGTYQVIPVEPSARRSFREILRDLGMSAG